MGGSMLRILGTILIAVMAWSTPSAACELFGDEARYHIEHEMFGRIGEESLTLRCIDDLIVVDRTVDIDVRVLMASFYQRHARYTEIWRGDHLIRFQGRTDDDGVQMTLAAEVSMDDAIVIKGSKTSVEAPPTVMPTDPWHLKLINRTLLFDRLDGHVSDVSVVDLGTDQLKIDGHAIETRKFAVSGPRDQEFWFDRASGLWLKSTIAHGSGDITITRQNWQPPSHLAEVSTDAGGR